MRHFNSQNLSRRLSALVSMSALAVALSVGHATEPSSDASLKASVQAALHGDKSLYARHIDVSVKQGVVRLAGFVQKPEDVERAKKDATSVAGVQSVKNEITVKENSESNTSGGN